MSGLMALKEEKESIAIFKDFYSINISMPWKIKDLKVEKLQLATINQMFFECDERQNYL